MSRAPQLVIFLLVALGVLALMHYYLWRRLVSDPALPPGLARALTVLLVLGAAGVPLVSLTARQLDQGAVRPLALVAFSWLGLAFLLFVLLLAGDLGRGLVALVRRGLADMPPADPERRLAVSRLLAAGTALLGFGAGAVAIESGLARVLVRRVEVELDRLPPELDGTVIVQLTDVHVGPTIGRDFVEEVVQSTNELKPDLIAITGDLVDGTVEQLRDHTAPLAALEARYGVYFVTGNHEYYSGAESWCAELERLNVRVLRNERVSVGTPAASFDLAGVTDYTAGRFGDAPDLGRACAGRDPSRELVLLAHQPRAVHEAEAHGVGLQLSGHTHGGQIWPWNFLVRLQQPVVAGLARIGRTLIYVSRGTGYWGPPMRLGIPAEITRIELRAKRRSAA